MRLAYGHCLARARYLRYSKCMRKFFLACVLTSALGCASAPLPGPRPMPVSVSQTLRVRADVEFTPHERALLSWAVRELREQSNGALRIELVYDLDGAPTAEPRLVRSYSFASIFFIIEEQKRGNIYGLTIDDSAGLRTYLLVDRIGGDVFWIRTAMHEFAHMFRADHVLDPHAVLYASTGPQWYNGVQLTDADRDEIARVLALPPSQVRESHARELQR